MRDFESTLYEFAGERSIINEDDLIKCLSANDSDFNELIKILCEMTFLGQEIQEGKFEYYSEKRSIKITDKLAHKLSQRTGVPRRYQINPAFHAYLEIEKI